MSEDADGTERQLALLREVDAVLGRARMRYWLRGGWALDFLLGTITREHSDIDLVTWRRHAPRLTRLLAECGFLVTDHGPSTDFEKDGIEINVLFIEPGAGVVYTSGFRTEPRWHASVLARRPRRLAKLSCRTISPQGLLIEIENTPRWLNRPPRAKDADTMRILRQLAAPETVNRYRSLGGP